MSLEIKDVSNLIIKATKEKEKENLFLLYLADRPYLKNDKGFNSYLKEHIKPIQPIKIDTRSKDEIMQELLERK